MAPVHFVVLLAPLATPLPAPFPTLGWGECNSHGKTKFIRLNDRNRAPTGDSGEARPVLVH